MKHRPDNRLGKVQVERHAITRVRELAIAEIEPLAAAATDEGFRAVRVLLDDWRSGVNRFDREGEALFVARVDGRVVGVCGLNSDFATNAGRVRRLYVLPTHRHRGIGRALVGAVVAEAISTYSELVLRTSDPGAMGFYEALGFELLQSEHHSHRLSLARD